MSDFPVCLLPAHVPEHLVRPFPFVFGTTTARDPFNELVPEVHRQPPIFYALHAYPGGTAAWVVRRAREMRQIYLDTEHFSNKDFSPFSQLIGESWSQLPAETDPPMHALYRAFVNPIFTPKAISKLEVKIRRTAITYIEAFRANGECDVMKEFAFEFPIKVFLELMGLPLSRTGQFLEWEMALLHNHDVSAIAAATRALVAYLRGEIDNRRANPSDDLISYGVMARIDGRGLTEDELLGFTFNLFLGGMDTISTHIGLQLRHLAEHPVGSGNAAEPAGANSGSN